MTRHGPMPVHDRVNKIGRRIRADKSLSSKDRNRIALNLQRLQKPGGNEADRTKAKILRESMQYMLKSNCRHSILAFLALGGEPYKLNKSTKQKKVGQIQVSNLKHTFKDPIRLGSKSTDLRGSLYLSFAFHLVSEHVWLSNVANIPSEPCFHAFDALCREHSVCRVYPIIKVTRGFEIEHEVTD